MYWWCGLRNLDKNNSGRNSLWGGCLNCATSEGGRKPQSLVPAGASIEGTSIMQSAPAAYHTHPSMSGWAHIHRRTVSLHATLRREWYETQGAVALVLWDDRSPGTRGIQVRVGKGNPEWPGMLGPYTGSD